MVLQRIATDRTSRAAVASIDVAVMRCEGEMGELELAHVSEELFRLAHRRYNRVILDLSAVDHVDYRGLQPLASRARLLRAAGGDLKLAGLSPYLSAIFRAAGVDQEFEVFETCDEAKAAFVETPAFAYARS